VRSRHRPRSGLGSHLHCRYRLCCIRRC
jgi:hypothetical protein